jgi:tRNA pseudouridine65 synthase
LSPVEAAPAPARDLAVLYCDAHCAVVDKPAGLMVHDSALARGETDFAADRLRAQFGRQIFLVHRLDRATSGCLLLAFDRESASRLGKQMMLREESATLANAGVETTAVEKATVEIGAVEKDYIAVCRGWPDADFVIDHALDGGPGKPLKKPAVTRFMRLATAELATPSTGFATSRYALLCAQPQSGRFRQIRRHLKHASHHLVGDSSHGDGRHNRTFRMLGIQRMLLHARRLAFTHPATGERVTVVAPFDAQFERAIALFGEVAC